jgi:excinuclease ABC subunit A
MPQSEIVIKGAREHNLQSVNLTIPKNQLVVMTGVSGSGKSSLAFDTLYAEGQRRYVESLSSYARQFLGQMPKPEVDFISGLAPSISIQQKTSGRNPRSTVGTITEIYDYLRVLYARASTPSCHQCGRPIAAQTRDQIVDVVATLPEGTRYQVLAPLVQRQKGEFRDLFADLLKQGFLRARVDGKTVSLSDDLKLDRQMKHTIDVVIDRLVAGPAVRSRLSEAVDLALNLAGGKLIVSPESAGLPPVPVEGIEEGDLPASSGDRLFSCDYACVPCGLSYEPPTPQLFSFNSPLGMCIDCNGLGMRHDFPVEQLIPDPALSLAKGALVLLGKISKLGRWRRHLFDGAARAIEKQFELKEGEFQKAKWQDLTAEVQQAFLYGLGDKLVTYTFKHSGGVWKHGAKFPGFIAELLEEYRKAKNPMRRKQLEKYMQFVHCTSCDGKRLNSQANSYRLTSKSPSFLERVAAGEIKPTAAKKTKRPTNSAALSLADVCGLSTQAASEFFEDLELSATQSLIAEEVLKEVRGRLGFLLRCGLGYLTLDRTAPTLSGGESQRIRLAGQIGCGLVGVVYILDEPSIGLHPRDNQMLLGSLQDLRDQGNTVIVVEHDEDTMRAADHIVDFGPGPGVRGGRVVAQGLFDDVLNSEASLTGDYLSGRKTIPVPTVRRPGNGLSLVVEGATHHNLQNVTAEFPLGKLIVITGVSGSGKSSLINDILWPALNIALNKGEGTPGAHAALTGIEHLDKAIDIDQSPIGRTPRSNPATYVKLFDLIRDLYTQLPESKLRGFKPGRFSFNVPGGRCEACEGHGANKLEMDFLADIWVNCPVCQGKRFNKETLEIRFKGKNIAEVLDMDVQQALVHFENFPKIKQVLQTLHDVGLDYIKLGQASPTLSGGEAQRVKLAKELSKRSTGKTVYILDEPTTGLHFVDVAHLLAVLQSFVDAGNTVIVVEHNLDVIKAADWLIDLGPEGGAGGGQIIGAGTPEELAQNLLSYTGLALAPYFASQVQSTEAKPTKKPSRKGASVKAVASAARRLPAPADNHDSPTKPSAASKLAAAPQWQTARRLTQGTADNTQIVIRGAAQHNLQKIDVDIPRDQITVFCGPSGSGKTSLAMDTLYAEGQRRYVESLSSYARQFLGQMPKPKVEHIHGLQPSIAIEQKTVGHTPRSTVGTVTEIYDYLRILFARLGVQHCPDCHIPVESQTVDDVIDVLMAHEPGTRLLVLAPQEVTVGQQYEKLWERLKEQGFRRVRVDGVTYKLEEVPEIDRRRKHTVEIVLDRITIQSEVRSRLAESIEGAFDLGKGVIRVAVVDEDRPETSWKTKPFSLFRACQKCDRSFEELVPHNFSFNGPLGWCEACEGLGTSHGTNVAALLGDPSRTLLEGAVTAWPNPATSSLFRQMLLAWGKSIGVRLDVPYSQLDPQEQRAVLYGQDEDEGDLVAVHAGHAAAPTGKKTKSANQRPLFWFRYKGLFPAIEEASRVSFAYRQVLSDMIGEIPCDECGGSRVRRDAAAVRLGGKSIKQLCDLPLASTLDFLRDLKLTPSQQRIAGELLTEATSRLAFLVDVGLHYLTLARTLPTLSGGESQRIRLAGQLGRALTGVLYVLDEPTIGLHPSDNSRLLSALTRLRDLGNTVVMVEHDREVLAAADNLYDFGPGAGRLGGQVVASGSPAAVSKNVASLTGKYLSDREQIPIPTSRRVISLSEHGRNPDNGQLPNTPGGGWIELLGARQNNLRNVDLRLPLGTLIAITGVSGSGKSSLIGDTLAKAVGRVLHRHTDLPGPHDTLKGLNKLNKLIVVDQQPLGNTPSSNPATYTGVFEEIRELFANLPDAKVRGFRSSRFSFNRAGGRCEACEGNGQKKIEMHFLPDVWVECEVCNGQRYNQETLNVKFRGKSIADVLAMPIGEALELFQNLPKIRGPLSTLAAIGLDYLTLGQSAPTLSGGEAQRVKLAAELARPQSGKTLYLLDEPTTGLHFDDIRKLLKILNSLVDAGNTVVVIEHNLDVIKTCDWVVDMGPLAGAEGGFIVAEGTPEDLIARVAPQPVTNKRASQKGRKTAVASGSDAAITKNNEHRSLTAECLVPMFQNAVRAERESLSAKELLKRKSTDITVRELGESVKMPWEVDGRKWHIETHIAANGAPCRWDRNLLVSLANTIEADGRYAEINWAGRSVVEVTGPTKVAGWFLHAMTGDEWFLTLKFRVTKGTFEESSLKEGLDLVEVNDLDDIPVFNRVARVRIKALTGGLQEVSIVLNKQEEFETPAFQQFLKTALGAFPYVITPGEPNSSEPKLDLEELAPWKKLKKKWHLMQKGFLQGEIEWNIAVLEELAILLEKLFDKGKIDWTAKVLVKLYRPAEKTPCATLVTKRPASLDLELLAPTGRITLGTIRKLGADQAIESRSADEDLVRIQLKTVKHVQDPAFIKFLTDWVKGVE